MSVTNGNGNVTRNDASNAETELALIYIGEKYITEEVINRELIDKYNKYIKEKREAAQSKAKSIERPESPENKEHISKEYADIDVPKSPKNKDPEIDIEFIDPEKDDTVSGIKNLLQRAMAVHYNAFMWHEIDDKIYNTCADLWKKDYKCEVMGNQGGSVCWNYPANIHIPIGEKVDPGTLDPSTEVPGFLENFEKYCKTAKQAAVARCRCRFPVPVILYNGKFICRSGTLAVLKGAVYETIVSIASKQHETWRMNFIEYACGIVRSAAMNLYNSVEIAIKGMEEMKTVDSSILDLLNIRYICDLMVEFRKIHTTITVSSSETVNELIYGKFRLVAVPYPGCEYFTKYHKIRSDPQYEQLKTELVFEWKNPEVTKAPDVKVEESTFQLDWKNYETWDLETLTKNYIRLILHFLDKGDGGILIHCISGWDRTPLFICLLRVSLWADKLIHKTLSVVQMAYFTLGYDWYLFGHNLPTRQRKEEEIMHFGFKFLPCIASKEFSINHERSTDEEFLRKRKDDIEELSKMVLDIYDELLDKNKKESSESENPATEE